MSLIPPPKATSSHVQDVANSIKGACHNFIQSAVAQVTCNLRACWADPLHTPQEFMDQFGDKAGDAMSLNGKLVELIMGYETATGLTLLDPAVIALVGQFTVNPDGTVTVG